MDRLVASKWQKIKSEFSQVIENLAKLYHRGQQEPRPEPYKRIKIILAAVLAWAWVVIIRLNIRQMWYLFAAAVIFSLVFYLVVLWVLYFKVKRETMVSVVALPSVFSFLMQWFIFYVFSQAPERVSILSAFMITSFVYFISMYAVLLTTNILNVNMFFKIPLAKLGESFLLVFNVVSVFIWSYLVRSYLEDIKLRDLSTVQSRLFYLSMGLFWIAALIYMFFIFFYNFTRRSLTSLNLALVVFALIGGIGTALTLYLSSKLLISLIIGALIYVVFSAYMHEVNRTLGTAEILELAGVLGILGVFAVWVGIP